MNEMKGIFLFMLVLIFCSCWNEKQPTEEIDFSSTDKIQSEQMTPDVSSYSKRRRRDLIQHLYEQALNKDNQLSLLDDKIRGMTEVKRDSLFEYNEFTSYNDLYYAEADRYVNTIQDSTKRRAVKEILLNSRNNLKREIRMFEEKNEASSVLKQQLDDQYRLMKILISESLISSYQENKPNIKSIEGLNDQYKAILSETDKYTKSIK